MAGANISVKQIVVRGNDRTREHIVTQELARALTARTYDELGEALVEGTERLRDLGIFKSVDVLLDAAGNGRVGADGMVPATVVVRVAERNRLTAQTGTYLQNGEGSMEASLASRNSLGYAEVLELQLTRGHERSNAFRLNLSKPRPLGLGCTAQLGARKLLASRERIASHSEKTQAADATVAWGSPAGRLGSHSLTYELALREATKLTPAASAAVHACARSSLKSALRYTLLLDRRDHPLTPSSGGALRLVSELAGVSGVGDERWLKQTAEASAHVTLWERVGLVAGLSLVVGAIVPFGGPAPPPPAAPAGARPAGWAGGAPASRPPGAFLTDRFLLGGVSSVRGFRTHAIGPRAERRLLSPDELAVYADAARRAATRATFDVGGFGGSALARMEGHDESVGPPALPRGRFDALGGEVSAHVLGTLSCALPAPLAAYGVRAHVFANGGSLDEWEAFNQSGASVRARTLAFASGARASVGFGLVAPTPVGRLELNVCRVLRKAESDSASRPLQLGLCYNFL